MSSAQQPTTGDKERNPRRRRPGGSRRRTTGPRKSEGEATSAEPRVRKERPVSLPFPMELIGKKSVGLVAAIVRRGRLKFGFINLGLEEKPETETARIYFSFDHLSDADLFLRRGYPVEFVSLADEKGRPYANEIKLTENGKQVAAEREATISQQRLERSAEESSAPKRERAPRERRERKAVEPRPLSLTVTCDGKSGSKIIEFDVAQSVGKLKNVACTEFEAPIHYNVFHVAKEGQVFLTKAILVTLSARDTIHLAEPKDVPVAK